jgi:flagellin-like hook-associated protein FlgL
LNDLIVGAFTSSPNGLESGSAYVVFGKSDGNAVELSQIEQDSNDNGFVINGASAGDIAGKSVSGAGDVNGDGLDDVIIGAPMAEPNSYYGAGKSYVVYGKSDGASVELSSIEQDTNASGFVINGISDRDFSGTSVSSAGDVNDDGLSDLIVGSYGRPNGGVSGTSYVIFGKNDGTKVDLSDIEDGSNTQGFAIDGSSRGDQAGISVSSAGDMNEDGLADVVLGASGSDINGNKTGAGYVIFGKTDNETINLSDLEKDPMLYANTSVVVEGKELSIDLGIFHDGVHADYFAAATAIAAYINGDIKLSELGYSASAATIQQVADGIYAEGDVIVSRANSPVTAVAPSLLNKQDCENTINRIDSALQTLNSQRASLGAISNRLDHIVANNTNAATNVSKSLGRIQDADFAAESTSLAKNQILQQASTAMLAQANASKQNILELLQG